MATLKAVTRPLIQVNALEHLLDKVKTPRKVELPDDVGARIQITMTPDPEGKKSPERKRKQPNQIISSHSSIQNTLQIRKRHYAMGNAGQVLRQGETTHSSV